MDLAVDYSISWRNYKLLARAHETRLTTSQCHDPGILLTSLGLGSIADSIRVLTATVRLQLMRIVPRVYNGSVDKCVVHGTKREGVKGSSVKKVLKVAKNKKKYKNQKVKTKHELTSMYMFVRVSSVYLS